LKSTAGAVRFRHDHKKNRAHITDAERGEIEILLRRGYSRQDIADAIGKGKSSVVREVNRNRSSRTQGARSVHPAGMYAATLAAAKARLRRTGSKYAGMLLHENDELRTYVVEKLKIGWSPKTIAGRMRYERKPFYASDRAIYGYLYSPRGQRYCRYLRTERSDRQKRKPKKAKRTLIPNKTSIHDRPSAASDGSRYGDYEGDTVLSGKSTGSRVALVTLYGRKAMYTDAVRIQSLSPTHHNPAVRRMFGKLRKSRTWTLDNGHENVHHGELERQLKIKAYFCDPYSSWQKPGIENANKLIRRYIPKGSDIAGYSHAFVKKMVRELNDTPRKSLAWKTPNEVMREQKLFRKNPKKKAP
jgi:IS30 family transposase